MINMEAKALRAMAQIFSICFSEEEVEDAKEEDKWPK
jgi:hypothetical protein